MSAPALAAAHDRHGRPVLPGSRIQAVLFDLDGTLVDSAPDLAGAANDMRLERGLRSGAVCAAAPGGRNRRPRHARRRLRHHAGGSSIRSDA